MSKHSDDDNDDEQTNAKLGLNLRGMQHRDHSQIQHCVMPSFFSTPSSSPSSAPPAFASSSNHRNHPSSSSSSSSHVQQGDADDPGMPSCLSSSAFSIPAYTALTYVVSFCIACVLIIVPLSLMSSVRARRMVSDTHKKHFDAVREQHRHVMSLLLSVQQDVAQLDATLELAEKLTEALEVSSRISLKKSVTDKAAAVAQIEKLGLDFHRQIADVAKEMDDKGAEQKKHYDETTLRFVVKWHAGKDGVQTSPRYATEEEARQKYESLGDKAKKLMVFDGEQWMTTMSFGADNWLACMQNNAKPQPGDCKTG